MTRILVTGSRAWPDQQAVWTALKQATETYGTITVVHGACPTGADKHAADWAYTTRAIGVGGLIHEERHSANWHRYGTAAGPIRNQAMVNSGAVLCLAFPYGKSPGTRDCMHRAKLAGIRVIDLGTDKPPVTEQEPEALW